MSQQSFAAWKKTKKNIFQHQISRLQVSVTEKHSTYTRVDFSSIYGIRHPFPLTFYERGNSKGTQSTTFVHHIYDWSIFPTPKSSYPADFEQHGRSCRRWLWRLSSATETLDQLRNCCNSTRFRRRRGPEVERSIYRFFFSKNLGYFGAILVRGCSFKNCLFSFLNCVW